MPAQRLHLTFLTDSALEQIEDTAYRLLSEVGISLQHARATEMLHGLGCRIERGRTYIPADVIRWALENVRPEAEFYCRDGTPAFRLGDGQIRFHNGGGPPFVYDLDTAERRPATVKDTAEMTRLLDALPHVDTITPLFGPQDVPPPLLAVASTHAMLLNTNKPVSAAALEKPEHVSYVVEMAAACCGGMEAFRQRPTMGISVSPVSPLTFTEEVTATILAVVEHGAPFHSLPAPSLGATGPITLAGALAQQHAEVLASFVIVAAAHPGHRVTYCSRINPIDMRTAVSSWGGPEVGMASACATQLAHRLGLPCDGYGLCSSAAIADTQFGYERFANAFTPALAGIDIMSGVGNMDSGLAGAFEVAVIDNEMIGYMKHIVANFEVTPETLAFDVMREVILRDGVFLGELHTVQHMRRRAVWSPTVADRERGAGILANARQRAKELLRTHEVKPLPEDTIRELDAIMARARRELADS